MVSIGAVATAQEITVGEEESIVFMREEEKLARDVYIALGDAWNERVFDNIARAEEQHMEAVLSLLEEYDVDDPILGPGEFANEELQSLYDELVARGTQSLEEALRVGALIEEVDIEDLQAALDNTSSEDIRLVYERLLAGSENHLRAFVSQLDRLGATYEPEVLDGDYFNGVVAETQDRGGRRGPRRGRGA
jgi:hypothetical protein